MESIKELREYAALIADKGSAALGRLNMIADTIETEHEKELHERYTKGFNEGYDYCFAGAGDWLADHEAAMAEHGWVKLPTDADGVPIHIGDKVTLYGRCVYEVEAIFFYKDRVSVAYGGESGCGCDSANNFHHYHEMTVEDRLWDLIDALGIDRSKCSPVMVAEVARKLRLAEDATGAASASSWAASAKSSANS